MRPSGRRTSQSSESEAQRHKWEPVTKTTPDSSVLQSDCAASQKGQKGPSDTSVQSFHTDLFYCLTMEADKPVQALPVPICSYTVLLILQSTPRPTVVCAAWHPTLGQAPVRGAAAPGSQ